MTVGILKSITNTGLDSELEYEFVAPLSINSNQPVFKADLANLRQLSVSMKTQRWEISAGVKPSNNSASFLVHSVLNGYGTAFYIRIPQVYRMGAAPITYTPISLSAAAAKGTSLLSVAGNTGKKILAGEFINIGTSDKVYMVVYVAPDGLSLGVAPPLRSAFNNGSNIRYADRTVMKARYDTDTMLGIKYTDGVLSDPGSINFIEAI